MFLWKKGVYRSENPTPTLQECLNAARSAIVRLYGTRIGKGFDYLGRAERANEFFLEIGARLGEPGINATRLGEANGMILPANFAPDAFVSLTLAAAYWWEANANREDPDRSWAALSQCHFNLGMASGPVTREENASRAGSHQSEQYLIFQRILLEELAKLDPKSEPSRASAIRSVMPAIRGLKPDATGKNTDANSPEEAEAVARLINGWAGGKAKFRAVHDAFERVMTNPPARGRPRSKGKRSKNEP